VTVVASLVSRRGRVTSVVGSLDRAAHAYLHTEYVADPEEREALYAKIVDGEAKLRTLDPKLVTELYEDTDVERTLQRAHKLHAESTRPDHLSS